MLCCVADRLWHVLLSLADIVCAVCMAAICARVAASSAGEVVFGSSLGEFASSCSQTWQHGRSLCGM